MNSRVYFDNAATTPLLPEVVNVMTEILSNNFGNPSSIHAEGRRARTLIEDARKKIAQILGVSIGEIFFTSCGTESNNMVIKNSVRDLQVNRIISTPAEHHCILRSLERIASEHPEVQIDFLPIDSDGRPDMTILEDRLKNDSATTLVSLMHANNETGAMIDLEHVAHLCRENNAFFHSDTVQTVGYFPINAGELGINFLSGSAHKFHGPKGVGFVYINNDNHISPCIDGGAQERNMRAGTENIHGIVGMAKALEITVRQREETHSHIMLLKEKLIQGLRYIQPQLKIVGSNEGPSHYKVLNVLFPPDKKTDLILMNLDIHGISVSGGSACSSGADAGSHVMEAIGVEPGWNTIRFSFSKLNTITEVEKVLCEISQITQS
jgi:cysteine desulfurase